MHTRQAQFMFTVIYVEASDGTVLAYVPELPGAHAQGKNRDEALLHLRDSLKLTLRANRRRSQANFAGLREIGRGTIEEPP
jgi:predicted RNase H-like HicB family nuclease